MKQAYVAGLVDSASTFRTAGDPIRADFLWREQRVIVQTDGEPVHATRQAAQVIAVQCRRPACESALKPLCRLMLELTNWPGLDERVSLNTICVFELSTRRRRQRNVSSNR